MKPADNVNPPARPAPADTRVKPEDRRPGVLIIVENLPVPFDRRVWQEAQALQQAGYAVSVICPTGRGHDSRYEHLDGIHIYRHPLPTEAAGGFGFLVEYSVALFWEFVLSLRVRRRHGFDVIHACNPPDVIFLVALFHKLFGARKFIFDQHDISPELYETKFGKRGLLHRLLLLAEKLTFRTADASIAANECFRDIAIERGGMSPERVFVKSYPNLARFRRGEPDAALRRRWPFLVGYVGIMALQDGVDRLVRAMAHIRNARGRTDVGCVIVGDGPEFARVKTLAVELGVADGIVFTGFLSGAALLAHLSAVDVGAIPDPPNPSNDKMSMNKVFEYMAMGIPFVHFDLAQCRSESAGGGIVVEEDSGDALGEAILALLVDPVLRQKLSTEGAARATREFRWESQAAALLSAYDLVLEDKRAPAKAVAAEASSPRAPV
jgi:glycosyltransferase involved in cell wall biosynthesis